MLNVARLKDLMLNDNGFGFDPSTGFTYHISLTGLKVVQWLKSGAEEEDLIGCLMSDYDVDRHNAVRDLDAFLESLTKYGLLKLESETAP